MYTNPRSACKHGGNDGWVRLLPAHSHALRVHRTCGGWWVVWPRAWPAGVALLVPNTARSKFIPDKWDHSVVACLSALPPLVLVAAFVLGNYLNISQYTPAPGATKKGMCVEGGGVMWGGGGGRRRRVNKTIN